MLLDVQDLSVEFSTPDGQVQAVKNVSFTLDRGETLAIVGESGSGKSQTVFAMMGLLAQNGRATGSVLFEDKEILNAPLKELNKVRAAEIAMIFQDPMTSLNPYRRISEQMAEVLMLHKGMGKSDALKESAAMLDAVRIPEAKARLRQYPHEFSGGMRQRVMIAMSLLCRPKLLIADEPTTALDVTVQAQIMTLLAEIQAEFGMAIVLITHDLGVVAGACRDTLVLYGGQVMEQGATETLFEAPTHPYTMGLLSAIPRLDTDGEDLATIPGNPPNMMNMPEGCPFSPRCPFVVDKCHHLMPLLMGERDHRRACHRKVEELVA
ncbi:oligopeptide ABC transporter ATP-binding protein OppD [Abyssibius alkaniclasticus]|uniref:oligopeptide/dipeptide ABC transporter ATP-binding protein n=1 Tax=Abyssibius alkaniclasticus TaxID=2881234 RepID=UPI002363D142|nr:oligopeptide/dipeptide ABC transporter ATP-binding protein [Abyssibius alkaniclasticus]UPH70989.1 oligopeptide ABC transporter ATP-binding protein OppD [Abyssibius alkaniclasticus]